MYATTPWYYIVTPRVQYHEYRVITVDPRGLPALVLYYLVREEHRSDLRVTRTPVLTRPGRGWEGRGGEGIPDTEPRGMILLYR